VANNARQMLAGLPVRMAEGGEAWTPGESVGRQRALESGNEAAWLAQVKASADAYMARANPATAAEAYDAMVQSGIGIKDLLDAGVSQATIDKALSVETDAEQKAINNLTRTALTNTLAQNPSVAGELASRGAQNVYSQSAQFVRGLQNEGMTDDERRQLQQVASQQGWGFSDIRAAGVDPTVLFKPFTAPVAKPPVTPVSPAPVPFPAPVPYTPVQVYQPLPSQPDIYAAGQPALDTAFRNSPPRTVSPVTGQYMYTPAASLRPATGAGMSWTPPVVTSRPRQLLDVAPTASASQLYTQSRQEQDRALRSAFSSANIPARGMDVYDWQARLRSGEYTNPTGMFDSGKFNQDFQAWSANRGTDQIPAPTFPDYYEGSTPRVAEGQTMQPQMFLGFADGGDVRARELLDRLKKSEGAEGETLGADDSYSQEQGTVGLISQKVGRGARALRDIAVNLTPLSQMEKDATRISLEHFPDSKQYGGESDALRHMLFQAQAVQRFGQPAAKALSLINEYGLGILEAQPKEHIRMDLGNDALGREIGLSGMSEEEQLRAILDLIESGKASVVNPQQQEQEFAEGGLATAPSPRMARASQLAAQRAEEPQTESRTMLERLERFASLDAPQDMTLGETAVDIGMGFVPVVGTAQGARDFERARRDSDNLGMVLSAASMIPVVGGAVKAARTAGKASKAADDLAALTAKAPTTSGIAIKLQDKTPKAVKPKVKTPKAGVDVLPPTESVANLAKFLEGSVAPPVVYHSTKSDFDVFSLLKLGRNTKDPTSKIGFFTAADPASTEDFITYPNYRASKGSYEEGANIMPLHLSIKNPVEMSSTDFMFQAMGLQRMKKKDAAEAVQRFIESAKAEGHDGLVIRSSPNSLTKAAEFSSDNWVAFDPSQIKSAIGNVGTFDPTNPVITKAKGGEVSSPPSPQELLAQIDRSMANSPAPAYGTASSAPDREVTDSRNMLMRISDAFGKNVTAPVVGSELDMTAGLGDLAQMGIKAGANKLGLETKPFTPVSSAIQEAIGVEGYDPYSPAAIATSIGLPAAAALRAAGTAARGSRPLMMSEAMPRTPRGRRPAPGSAEELLSRLGPIVDREAAVYASSELAAMGAREVAPDNFTAEVAAAIAGGGAYNTLDNILSSAADAPTTARSQMAEIYSHVPTTENPFVGRLDTYVANLPGKIGRDELLAQMRGKFRNSEILRVQRALEGVDPKTKLQPNEVLEKLQAEYDPSDLRLTTITPSMFRSEGGRTFHESMDNPWKGQPAQTAPDRGVIVLSRPVLPGQKRYSAEQRDEARRALDRFNDFTGNPETWSLTLSQWERDEGLTDFKEPFWAATPMSNLPVEKREMVYGILDEMELTVTRREQQKRILQGLEARLSSDSQKPLVSAEAFNAEKNRLLEQGGMEPSRVVDQAYVNVFKNSFSFPEMLGREDGLQGLLYDTRAMLDRLPLPQDVTTAQEADAFVSNVFLPALREERSAARRAESSKLGDLAVALQNTGIEDYLRGVLTAAPADRSGVNPKYTGQHPSLTGKDPGQIGFMRTSDVVADVSGIGNAKGIYLHEMQSDLLDDISTQQGRIASGATLAEVRDSIPGIEGRISMTLKEKAGDRFAQNPHHEEVMNGLLETILNDPERARVTANDYTLRYPEVFNMVDTPDLLRWLSRSGTDSVVQSTTPLVYAKKRLKELQSPEADRKRRTGDFFLDEAFPGMMSDSKTLQQMFIKTAVKSAMDRGMNFVALTSPPLSAQPQLYEKVPQNAKDVIKDLGEGFRVEQIRMRSPKDWSSNSFPVLAITWDQQTSEGREGVNRIMTRGVPFKEGGEVTTQPDDLKNLLSFLDKKPASKRK